MPFPRLVLVDNQMAEESFVSIGPLVLAGISDAVGLPVEFVRFPHRHTLQSFIDYAASADIVAFSTVCSNYPRVLLMAEHLKALNPKVLIVLGGAQASITALDTLWTFSAVDLLIRGEAELSWHIFSEQAKTMSWDFAKIPSAVWRANGRIEQAPQAPPMENLDQVPPPLFEAIQDGAAYDTARVEVGRGCPYRCAFCSTSAFFNRKHRMKSPQRIVMEMDRVHSLHGIRKFDFVHDMFTANREVLRHVCRKLQDRPYQWGCWSRADVLNPKMLALLKESGCMGLFIGLESGSPRIQKAMRKNLDLPQAVGNMRIAKEMGLSVTSSIILGYPGETRADLRDTLLLVAELMTTIADQVNFLPFAPLAGTDAAQQGGHYLFDGQICNFLETEQNIPSAEANLISRNFALFSAFYYPADNEYPRADYLALVALMDNLKHYPPILRFLLERDRAGFIDFLIAGSFGVDVYQLSRRQIAEAMMQSYAMYSDRGWPVTYLLNYLKLTATVASAPVGYQYDDLLPTVCADLVLPGLNGTSARHPDYFVRYAITNTWDGPRTRLLDDWVHVSRQPR